MTLTPGTRLTLLDSLRLKLYAVKTAKGWILELDLYGLADIVTRELRSARVLTMLQGLTTVSIDQAATDIDGYSEFAAAQRAAEEYSSTIDDSEIPF
jgi:hypothetical protein